MKSLLEKYKIYGLRKTLNYSLRELFYRIFYQKILKSYSQCGEDLIIDKILNYKNNGFYVDVGANDAVRFSNTKRFYDKGWRGINIEPNPIKFKKLTLDRVNDINLNTGIASKKDALNFYWFFPDTLSTFSKETANKYIESKYKLIDTVKIAVQPLSNILYKHALDNKIDFMSIDTEGFDLIVLKSNDWERFKPKVICVESNNLDSDAVHSFLCTKGYKKHYFNKINSIYTLE